jgi:hypothetical protein
MIIEEIFTNERNKIVRCLADILLDIDKYIQMHKQIENILNDTFSSEVNTVNNMIVNYVMNLSTVKILILVLWII